MWAKRDVVIDAYANEGRSSTAVQLGGVDLTVELTPIDSSPYEVIAAPDTRRVDVAPAFATEVALAVDPVVDPAADGSAADGPAADGRAADDPAAVVDGDQPSQPPATPAPAPASPLPIYGGTAKLSGRVAGPEGPAAFATVRLERHTSQGVVTKDLVADGDGRWGTARLLGGRYRVWAWAAHESLAMSGSQVFFLDHDANRETELALDLIDADPRVALTDGGNIYVGLSGTVAVSVTSETVDPDGRVVVRGLPGTVVTFNPSAGVSASTSVAVTDDDGVARFTLQCLTEGRSIVNVRHSADVREQPTDPERVHVFALPACVPIPPPPAPSPTSPATQPATPETPTGSDGGSSQGGSTDG